MPCHAMYPYTRTRTPVPAPLPIRYRTVPYGTMTQHDAFTERWAHHSLNIVVGVLAVQHLIVLFVFVFVVLVSFSLIPSSVLSSCFIDVAPTPYALQCRPLLLLSCFSCLLSILSIASAGILCWHPLPDPMSASAFHPTLSSVQILAFVGSPVPRLSQAQAH